MLQLYNPSDIKYISQSLCQLVELLVHQTSEGPPALQELLFLCAMCNVWTDVGLSDVRKGNLEFLD